MRVSLERNRCIIRREPGDRKPTGGGWGSAEHRLYYWIKSALQKQGYDVIKRRLQADGHMMGDEQTPYIRERKHRFYIYDGKWAIRDIVEAFASGEPVELLVQRNEEP